MITRYGLATCKPAHVPMEPDQSVGPDPHTKARRHVQELLTQVQTDLDAQKLNVKLSQYDSSAALLNQEDKQRYMQVVGSLKYVATATRPDICFAATSLAQYMSCPTHHLLKCAERVFRYLSATQHLALTCKKSTIDLHLVGNSDADWAGCEVTRKSTLGILVWLNGSPI
jgi:hypothetical protein